MIQTTANITDKEIIEGNKLINGLFGYCTDKEDDFYLIDCYYHKNWNELMRVVEKIEALHDDNFWVKIFDKRCHITVSHGGESMGHYIGETKIEATYKAVIQFIEWLNEQNKN